MTRIIILTFTPAVRRRMLDAAMGLRPVFCDGEDAMFHALRAGVSDAVVVGLRATAGDHDPHLISRVRERYPRMRIIGCVEGQAERGSELRLAAAASRAGANEIIIDDLDSYAAIYHRLSVALLEAAVAGRILEAVGDQVPAAVRRFIEYGVLHARRPVSVEAAAAAAGVHRRTLARQCRQAALPTPQELLSWSRLLFAAAMLDQPGVTADQIGHRMFSSPAVFRAMLRRYLGVCPAELKARGGFQFALAAFVRRLDRPENVPWKEGCDRWSDGVGP